MPYLFFFILIIFTSNAFAAHPSVIHISKALHLNGKKELMADITSQVKAKDNIYATIHVGEYVRATFEQALDNHYDNSLYARPSNSKKPATIEVYPVYTDQKGNQVEFQSIATFPSISYEGFYKILLTKLLIPTDTFDFKITGGSVDIDYVVDPTYTILHNFIGLLYAKGSNPHGSLIFSGSTLYGMTNQGGIYNDGIIFSVATSGGTLTDLHDFSGYPNDGQNPIGNLTLSGSTLYGMTLQGGADAEGIIFSIATTGGTLTDLHTFSGSSTDGEQPDGSLIISGSTMYGMVGFGGNFSDGIIFSIATSGGTLTDLHDFSDSSTDGFEPFGTLTLSGSTLYGMTESGGNYNSGIIFSIATSGGTLTDLHDFSGSSNDGAYPLGLLTISGSTLYGMAEEGGFYGEGLIFSLATSGGTITDLHDFSGSGTDGDSPQGDLLFSGSTLYGMTRVGGATGDGIVFSIATSGGVLTDLHDFSGSSTDGEVPDGSLTLSGSTLYGMTIAGGGSGSLGVIFSIPTTTTFYGMTYQGGSLNQGVAFSYNIVGGPLTDLHNFAPTTIDGAQAWGDLTISGSTVYGMASGGGAYTEGLIFSIATSGGTLTDLHDFSGSTTDGEWPYNASLALSGNTLYGMTNGGGAYFGGIIFSIATSGGALTDLHDFSGGATDGQYAYNTPIISGSTMYGTVQAGGLYSDGIIFSMATSGGTLTDLHDFSGVPTDGSSPQSKLILSGSTLYGVTVGGGSLDDGMIFSIATSGGALTNLHNFTGSASDGATPGGTLTRSGSKFYGSAGLGGTFNDGIIFSIATTGGALTILHNFSGSATDGNSPNGSLILSGSNLYGMTNSGGLSSDGIIFSIKTSGGTLTDLHDFTGQPTDGAQPSDSVTLSGSTLYGMTYTGGSSSDGTVFSYYAASIGSNDSLLYGTEF